MWNWSVRKACQVETKDSVGMQTLPKTMRSLPRPSPFPAGSLLGFKFLTSDMFHDLYMSDTKPRKVMIKVKNIGEN